VDATGQRTDSLPFSLQIFINPLARTREAGRWKHDVRCSSAGPPSGVPLSFVVQAINAVGGGPARSSSNSSRWPDLPGRPEM